MTSNSTGRCSRSSGISHIGRRPPLWPLPFFANSEVAINVVTPKRSLRGHSQAELGHGGEAMVRRVYGHLGQVRRRAAEVEYRIEAFEDKLKGRLVALRGAV